MSSTCIPTPLGPIGLCWKGDILTGVDLVPAAAAAGDVPPAELVRQIRGYFADGRFAFDLPVATDGTPFQRRVWALLGAIPAGRTRTYGELARELGSAPRAVGQACRANPCPIVVPCHRVVGAQGLGGFAGDRTGRLLAVKRWLLAHEGAAAAAGAPEMPAG